MTGIHARAFFESLLLILLRFRVKEIEGQHETFILPRVAESSGYPSGSPTSACLY